MSSRHRFLVGRNHVAFAGMSSLHVLIHSEINAVSCLYVCILLSNFALRLCSANHCCYQASPVYLPICCSNPPTSNTLFTVYSGEDHL